MQMKFALHHSTSNNDNRVYICDVYLSVGKDSCSVNSCRQNKKA